MQKISHSNLKMERPEWCKSFNCPNSPGGDVCYINNWITRGWPSNRKATREIKNSMHQKYGVMAEENPEALKQECADKSFDLGKW